MEASGREKAMWLLRAAADILEEEGEGLILPGWDTENELPADRCRGVREAAKAVAAEGVGPDSCTEVPFRKLGFLVRYIGDLMEE